MPTACISPGRCVDVWDKPYESLVAEETIAESVASAGSADVNPASTAANSLRAGINSDAPKHFIKGRHY